MNKTPTDTHTHTAIHLLETSACEISFSLFQTNSHMCKSSQMSGSEKWPAVLITVTHTHTHIHTHTLAGAVLNGLAVCAPLKSASGCLFQFPGNSSCFLKISTTALPILVIFLSQTQTFPAIWIQIYWSQLIFTIFSLCVHYWNAGQICDWQNMQY